MKNGKRINNLKTFFKTLAQFAAAIIVIISPNFLPDLEPAFIQFMWFLFRGIAKFFAFYYSAMCVIEMINYVIQLKSGREEIEQEFLPDAFTLSDSTDDDSGFVLSRSEMRKFNAYMNHYNNHYKNNKK
jgi:hypothetical protein